MKVTPSKVDIDRVLMALSQDKKNALKIKCLSMPVFNTLYLNFMQSLAAECDKLMFLDRAKKMTHRHVVAAAKVVLPKYSFADIIKENLPNVSSEGQKSGKESESDEESESEEESGSEEKSESGEKSKA